MLDLNQYEDAFRHLLDSAPDALVVVNRKGSIVLVNKMVERMFGYEPESLVGQTIEILLPSRFRNDHVKLRGNYFNHPNVRFMGTGMTLYAQHRDGKEFPVEISLSPVETDDDMLITAAVRDISDRVKIQQELEQHMQELARSNAELEQFAYVASHDLQEPLRIIASFAQLLGRRYKGKLDDDADEFINYIVDGATRMQNLINDLLSYSRITTKGQEFTSTDCNEIMERVMNNLQFAVVDNQAEVSWDTLPTVMADATQMGQLFQNLVSNAMKYHAENTPQVKISVKQENNYYVFSVKDNGIGIEPEYADRIFLLFQRLHGKQEYEGTGIGLAICKKIVERHGGQIWVESTPGSGSTFLFTIPALLTKK